MDIVIIDNYDSFTYNVSQALQSLGCRVQVHLNDRCTPAQIAGRQPSAVIISPGPMSPAQSGVSMQVVRELTGVLPILGICLGFQCLLACHGRTVRPLPEILHGRTSPVFHTHDPLFEGLPDPFPAARYHSLGTHRAPASLRRLAWTESGVLMAARHPVHPVAGVQFHPESFLTPDGSRLFQNFLRYYARPS